MRFDSVFWVIFLDTKYGFRHARYCIFILLYIEETPSKKSCCFHAMSLSQAAESQQWSPLWRFRISICSQEYYVGFAGFFRNCVTNRLLSVTRLLPPLCEICLIFQEKSKNDHEKSLYTALCANSLRSNSAPGL